MAGRDVVRRFSRWLTILAILNLYIAPMPPTRFWLNQSYGLGGDVVWRISSWRPSWISELNDFGHSESLCHCDASHQVLAQSTHGLGGDVLWRISRWPPWWPSWISEQNYLSNSESLCCCNASHHVLAQSHLQFGRRCRLKYFKMATMRAILEIGTEMISAMLNLYNSTKPPIKFQLNLTYCLGSDVIWRISRWPPWRPSWILEQNDFSISESLCHCNASHQVLAQSNLQFGRRCRLKNFKMAAMAAILDIGTDQF